MWGTRGLEKTNRYRPRFIPTHVGNTYRQNGMSHMFPVHPHACGEHTLSILRYARSAGSSPRMWGTPLMRNRAAKLCRFIPTHVGNTTLPPLRRGAGPVHPHACGEHPAATVDDVTAPGSSPRMWGTRHCARHPVRRERFIPTHVGNTRQHPAGLVALPVHPHACGEHSVGRSRSRVSTRFIPTHVGNTKFRRQTR